MADFPYFPFFAEDFAAGTAAMSPMEVGIYIRALCHQWSHGFVPNDATKIARIAGALPSEVADAWPAVAGKFCETSAGKLQNARLEDERAKLLARIEARSSAGKAGAEARWSNGKRTADAMANALPKRKRAHSGRNGKTMPRAFDSDLDSKSGSKTESGSKRRVEASLPDDLRTPALLAVVDDWLSYKRERGEAYKPTGLKNYYGHLANAVATHGEATIIARLRKAMASGWVGWDHADASSTRGSPGRTADDPRGNLALRERLLAKEK
jgi:uncharacterized protein YdaU (DUF1376 family)